MKSPRILLALAAVALLVGCGGSSPEPEPEPSYVEYVALPQNWSDAEKHGFWFTSQGSQLIPYAWFLTLEQEGSEELFRADANLDRLRFIPSPVAPENPDALPIGFSKETAADETYVGMTCAACHTGRLDYEGKAILIEGGPALHDFNAFLNELLAAMQATGRDEAKFTRFEERLGADAPPDLRDRLTAATEKLAARVALNRPDHPAGFARVDAFGNIFNQVSTTFLGVPENGAPPNAPVSYPPLWDTPQHDRVQWNGSAINAGAGPLIRNAGEVLGVFGWVNFTPEPGGGGYGSSVDTPNLERLEAWITTLESPVWPADVLPAIDQTKADEGGAVYQSKCAGCHALIDRADPARKVTAHMVPLTTVGTDPAMAQQFGRTSQAGELEGRPVAFVAGDPIGATTLTGALVVHGVVGALLSRPPAENLPQLLQQYLGTRAQQPAEPASYKARPLNGVWSTAPYLHNGSVPTLRAMLTPPAERPKTFQLGSREFDPAAVGYAPGGSFTYDTALPGNSNAGHPFGTDLAPEAKEQLLEYLKTL